MFSVTMAILAILRFYRRSKEIMKPRRALNELICFKIIVFLNFLQTVGFPLHRVSMLSLTNFKVHLPLPHVWGSSPRQQPPDVPQFLNRPPIAHSCPRTSSTRTPSPLSSSAAMDRNTMAVHLESRLISPRSTSWTLWEGLCRVGGGLTGGVQIRNNYR